MHPDRLAEAIEFVEKFVGTDAHSHRRLLVAFSRWCEFHGDRPFHEFIQFHGGIDSFNADKQTESELQETQDVRNDGLDVGNNQDLNATAAYTGSIDYSHSIETIDHAKSDGGEFEIGDQDEGTSRFEIRRKVAQGGLGVVFVAEDKQFQRYVAVKKVRSDRIASEELSEKFIFEAEVTGQLEHPGIVPVYALGIDSRRQPFYAMRLIRGEEFKATIQRVHANDRIDYSSMEFRQLLKRFIDVCLTVDYAHSRGVIHRDLKPANIMIGSHGETLVVDWGLARSITPREELNLVDSISSDFRPVKLRHSAELGSQTAYGSFSGTVAYAPPEQLLGELDQLGPATDIYSLGAILFEILTSKPSIRTKPKSLGEVVDLIKTGHETDPRQVIRHVPRSLVAICRKAMSATIEGRYLSARAMADDLERWLSDELVIAHRGYETVPERVGRLVRRHRSWTFPILFTLFCVFVISAISAFLINQSRLKEREAKQQAEINKQLAIERIGIARSAIDTMLVDSTSLMSEFPTSQLLQQKLLEAAQTEYEKLSQSNSSDPTLLVESTRAMVRVGDISHMKNDFDSAHSHYDRAKDQLETILKSNSYDQNIIELELAKLGLRKALAYDIEAKYDLAVLQFQDGLNRLRQLQDANPRDSMVLGVLARTLAQYGDLLARTGDASQAIATMQESLNLADSLDASNARRETATVIIATEGIARALNALGKTGEAQDACSDLEKLIRSASLEESQLSERLASLALTRSSIMRNLGLYEASLSELESAINSYQTLVDRTPDDLRFVHGLALSLVDAGILAFELSQMSKANDLLSQGEERFRMLVGTYPLSADYRDGLATAINAQSQIDMVINKELQPTRNRLEQAELLWIDLVQKSKSPHGLIAKLAMNEGCRARLLSREGEYALSASAFQKAVDYFNQLLDAGFELPEYHYGLSVVMWNWGWMNWRNGDPDGAKKKFDQAISELELLIAKNGNNPDYYSLLARVSLERPDVEFRKPEQSLSLIKVALQIQPENSRLKILLARALAAVGRFDEASKTLETVEVGAALEIPMLFASIEVAVATGLEENSKEQYDRLGMLMAAERPFDEELKFRLNELKSKLK